MDFKLEDYCSDNGLDFLAVKRGCDLYIKRELQPIIATEVQRAFQQFSANLISELVAAIPAPAKAGKARASGGKQDSGFAPSREDIVCLVNGSHFGNGLFTLNFYAQRDYGVFNYSVNMDQDKILSLFFTDEYLDGEMDDPEIRDVKHSNQGAFSNYSDVLSNIECISNYAFLLDVKRKVPKHGEVVEVISITPYSSSNKEGIYGN